MADTTDDDTSAVGRVARSPRRWLFGVLLVIAVYAVGLVVVGIDEALGAVTRGSILPLTGALLLQVAVVVLWGKVYGASAAAVTLAATISLATIAGLGSAGIVTAFLTGDLPTLALVIALPALGALVALVVTVVAVLRSPSAGDRIVGQLGRLHDKLGEHVDEWRDSLRDVTEDPPTPVLLRQPPPEEDLLA